MGNLDLIPDVENASGSQGADSGPWPWLVVALLALPGEWGLKSWYLLGREAGTPAFWIPYFVITTGCCMFAFAYTDWRQTGNGKDFFSSCAVIVLVQVMLGGILLPINQRSHCRFPQRSPAAVVAPR